MEGREAVPKFTDLSHIPWIWWVDPVPFDFRRVIKPEQLRILVQLQLNYTERILQMQLDFVRDLNKMLGGK